jgi:cobalamin biosynthesis protein CbiD
LASEAEAGSVRGARGSTGCCAAAAIAQSVINIIAFNILDLVTIGSPFGTVLIGFVVLF